MWRFTGLILALIIVALLYLLIQYYSVMSRNKNLKFPKETKISQIKNRYDLVRILKENVGNIVTVRSKDFIHVHQNRTIENKETITGRILEVDEDWINLEYDSRQFVKKESLDQLIFRIDSIRQFAVNINTNLPN